MNPERPPSPPALWCIHGNLQLPAVWRCFEGTFFEPRPAASKDPRRALPLVYENLWEGEPQGLWQWAERFCARVARDSGGVPQLLLGYSQGGRLALHAVLQRPSLWRAAIIIGADVGIDDAHARADRLARDQAWGQRFLTEPWDRLLAQWDAQAVFGGRRCTLPRHERDFSRPAIARIFDVLSKGRQDPLAARLQSLETPPILFVSGADDPQYVALGNRLANTISLMRHAVVEGAAHRVPWDCPQGFVAAVQPFLDRL